MLFVFLRFVWHIDVDVCIVNVLVFQITAYIRFFMVSLSGHSLVGVMMWCLHRFSEVVLHFLNT